MSLTLDEPDTFASLADCALEQMPYPVVVLDRDLRLRLANAAARERLDAVAMGEDPCPPFDAVLARSGRIPADVRLRILSCCGAEVRGRNTRGRHDAVFSLSPGHTIALFARRLGPDRWMVVLEDRHRAAGPGGEAEESHRDRLTGIGNRHHIEKQLAAALCDDDPDSQPAILVFDIDRFRSINDHLGRNGGDALLRAVAGRLRHATRDADQLARLEGDQFAVLQHNGQSADHLAARLVDLLNRPYLVRGEVVTSGISLGVARAPGDGATASELLHHADLARREAKDAGGHAWRRFGQSMADRARSRLDLESDLRKALALGQLSLAYQPKVNLRTRAVTGFEALARWTHPKRGMVPPALFIPVAEDIRLIASIGDWALRTACQEAAAWPEPLTVAVNVSARQLDDGQHFLTQVAVSLRESGLPARRLELEITESALTRRPDEARALLRDLHEMGVRIAIDDFGTGYSSLGQLRTFPFDSIKIDRSFVSSLDSDHDSGALVRAIATLGSGLGMTVIAEGVETRNQARMVEADGCTDIQGFLIGRPVPAAEVRALLARNMSDLLDA
ncbi:MAG: EAL domain-containing protein [Acetobacteraceae bacterium]|nr:EAL domain-containing protein [Acetobacteraceae bacterium]